MRSFACGSYFKAAGAWGVSDQRVRKDTDFHRGAHTSKGAPASPLPPQCSLPSPICLWASPRCAPHTAPSCHHSLMLRVALLQCPAQLAQGGGLSQPSKHEKEKQRSTAVFKPNRPQRLALALPHSIKPWTIQHFQVLVFPPTKWESEGICLMEQS